MLDKTNIKDLVIYVLVIGLFILAFLVLKPIIFSVIYGILFAYLVFPLYKIFSKKIKNDTLAASLFCLVLLIILVFIGFLFFQFMFRQTIDFYLALQKVDIQSVITKAMPSFISSTGVSTKMATTLSSSLSNLIANFLNKITDLITNISTVLLQLSVVLFVFFFSLRDGEKTVEYIKAISPMKKEVQDKFFKQFKDVTNSVIVGHILIGVIQGITAGIGYFIFGVQNALLLTFITIIAAIIPVVGPWLIWVPVDIYLFASGNSAAGLGFLIYGTILVSTLDNIIKPYVVSRGTEINSVIVVVGMIGGLFAFGVIGLIIGPLVLAYVLLVMELYRKNTIGDDLIFKKPEISPAK